ncbi:hypothetical protein IZY60_09940 [Lutibacter sp. B2]|nr:hypothetical protein [Lutibacter sp. B2]
MKKVILLSFMLCLIGITGCNDTTKSNISEKKNVTYEKYKGDWKLKVPGGEEDLYLFTSLETYYGLTGISISEINNNLVKGSIYSVTGAPSYRQAMVDFEGTLEDGKIIASYKDDGWEYTGNLELTLENGKILANITRDPTEKPAMWGIPAGEFTFIRPIKTERIKISDNEKNMLTEVLSLVRKDVIKPFDEGNLTDDMIINVIANGISLGHIDVSEFGEKSVTIEEGKIIFDKSVMNALAKRFFGVEIKEHKSNEIATFKNGKYIVFASGGVIDEAKVQYLMKDTENEGVYYVIVDYVSDFPEEGEKLEYEYLVKLQKNNYYMIKSITELEFPIDFNALNAND